MFLSPVQPKILPPSARSSVDQGGEREHPPRDCVGNLLHCALHLTYLEYESGKGLFSSHQQGLSLYFYKSSQRLSPLHCSPPAVSHRTKESKEKIHAQYTARAPAPSLLTQSSHVLYAARLLHRDLYPSHVNHGSSAPINPNLAQLALRCPRITTRVASDSPDRPTALVLINLRILCTTRLIFAAHCE